MFLSKTAFRATLRGGLLSLLFLTASALISSSHAATIAWWRFEDAPASGLASEVNPSVMNATQSTGSILHPSISGPLILDGTTGMSHTNAQSIYHSSGSSTLGSAATSVLNDVFVNNHASWTFEAIIRKPNQQNYGVIFGNGNTAGNGIQFGLGANGLTFTLLSNGRSNTNTVLPLDEWVHIAMVATATGVDTWDLNVYLNHELQTTASAVKLNTLDSNYAIGGPVNPMMGFIDELRISDSALTTDQMLQSAIPEPSMVAFLALGGLLLGYRCRRSLNTNA